MRTTLHLFVIIFSVTGFLIARHIARGKRGPKPLVCPVGADCDSVVRSEYSHFFGAPLEFIGMVYYGAVALGYALFALVPHLSTPQAVFLLLAFSTTAFIFSLYLTAIQAFTLRAWCTWCLTSAALSGLIFLASFSALPLNLATLLAANIPALLLIQFYALAVGLGSAVVAVIFLITFLGDFRIAVWERSVLKTLFELHWFSLGGLALTGVSFLYLSRAGEAAFPRGVTPLLTAVAVLIVASFLLHYIIIPRLIAVSQGGAHEHAPGELPRLRRRVLLLAFPVLASWFFIFSLRVLPVGASTLVLLGVFAAVIAVSAAASRALDKALPSV